MVMKENHRIFPELMDFGKECKAIIFLKGGDTKSSISYP